ncbi:glutathione S-transferase family protein [Anthocerotibacter panamensis]|uniref:glutathione S-transferase family protein n=1 Tax=Anthocerotibacter panamensis TaxID=2857077 RepID=UPI001C40808C|nr:glutathione S-transferase N-terminal domain-containing protein [Anthocerotibacter panamensis]
MIDLYTWGTPNGQKASIMLEESGLSYTVHPINITKGEQRTPEYLQINPNGKIPAIVDREVGDGLAVFESGAILIYVAEKSGRLLAPSGPERAQTLCWVFWQVGGLGPMIGQWGHFARAASEKIPYAINRYFEESLRLLGVLDKHLEGREYLTAHYSIADIANYPWVAGGFKFIGSQHPEIPSRFCNLQPWLDRVGQRPTVIAGMSIPNV